MSMTRRIAIAIACLTLLVAACGDDEAEPESVEVVGVNYEYQSVPETLAVGSDLSFRNDSDNEVHEIVVVRIDDDETRPLAELVQLPPEQAEGFTTTIGVSVALPGGEGMLVEGDDLVLDQPGRYALLCFIPIGSDVEMAEQLLAGPPPEGDGPPPSLGDGPPHVTAGMFAEFTVEE